MLHIILISVTFLMLYLICLVFFGIIPTSDVTQILAKFSDMQEFTKAVIITGAILVLFSLMHICFKDSVMTNIRGHLEYSHVCAMRGWFTKIF